MSYYFKESLMDEKPYLKQITVRKCKAQVVKPDGTSHICVFGDYETFMAKAMIYENGSTEDFAQTMTLAVRYPVGYVLEDGTQILFNQGRNS